MWKHMFNRFLGNEISKYVDSKNRHKKQVAAINQYFDEQEQIRQRNIASCKRFIEIADMYLREKTKIEKQFQAKEESMKKFFEHWGNTKIYQGVSLLTLERNELFKLLDLKPINYVSYKFSHSKDLSSTLELILDNTSIIKELKNRFKSRGIILIVYASLQDLSFGLRLE